MSAQRMHEAQRSGGSQENGHGSDEPQRAYAVLTTIRVVAAQLDDIELVRIASGNRIGAAERAAGDALPHLRVIHQHLEDVEHQATLLLQRAWRQHPLAPWAKSIPGCGEKLIARLIGEVGDPYTATPMRMEGTGLERTAIPDGEPYERLVSQLWSYCGVGDPARSRIPRNATQEELMARGKPLAKKYLHLLSESFVKLNGEPDSKGRPRARSPYRDVYDGRRLETVERVHAEACAPCGPAGLPAAVGSPWSKKHQHMDAYRIVSKRFLLDLWLEAKRLHESP